MKEVINHWFLLENELTKDISKGNLKMLDFSLARIKFLKPVVVKHLLQGCLDGEKEALCVTRRFLMNNGWWEKANKLNIHSMGYHENIFMKKGTMENEDKLFSFIMQSESLVHTI